MHPAFGGPFDATLLFIQLIRVCSLQRFSVKTHFLWRPQLRDTGDEMVLEAAVNGHADALVTFNVRDFGVVPSRFGIEVLLPREAIGRVKSL